MNTPEPTDYSLTELATAVDMEPRTIRSYIQQGLLRSADRMGRGARYSRDHLQRLQAIRLLRDRDGLSMAEIRSQLLVLSGTELAALAAQFQATHATAPLAAAQSTSALAYLQQVKQSLGGSWSGTAAAEPSPPSTEEPVHYESTLEQALQQLHTLGLGSSHRRSRGEAWFRLPITPDIELNIRGVRTPAELARFEQLAAILRDLLTGASP